MGISMAIVSYISNILSSIKSLEGEQSVVLLIALNVGAQNAHVDQILRPREILLPRSLSICVF